MSVLDIASRAAAAGSEILTEYWRKLGAEDAELKAKNDWVSRADREAEQAIISILAEAYPEDGFLCEESGHTGPDSERVWVIDPLDGTSNYLRHFPFWCISIALREKDEIVAAVIHQPLSGDWFRAEKGSGAWHGDERIEISNQSTLESSFLATGFPFRAMNVLDPYLEIFHSVALRAKGLRRAGSAALDLAYTAAGVFDGFFELHLAPWDIAAGSLLVTEAGGACSDFHGGEDLWSSGNIIAGSPGVHEELVRIVTELASPEELAR